jgi:SAM-dependent methyltransferase
MTALPRRDFRLRIVGALACLALLLYGAVSASKPRHAYVLSFLATGQAEGALQAAIALDDGMLVAPVTALTGEAHAYVVALPTRTIRGIRLIPDGSGTVRDAQVIRIGDPIRDLTAEKLRSAGTVYRKIDLDAAQSARGLRLSEPLHLLRDMQLAWMWRFIVILTVGATVLWLFSRGQFPSLARTNPRLLRFLKSRGATVLGCGLWFVAAFAVCFVYAGRLSNFGWNITEFIIANQLQDAGRYALGATYPTAIWRPVGPTFIVLAIDAFARDPVLTFQLLCGSAMASLTASIYLLNRALFGHLLAHAGAALAFATPAVSVSLINHAHAISHLAFLLVASPTLAASVIAILRIRDGEAAAQRWLWAASLGWAACYLCRPESMFMAACFFVAVILLAARRKQALRVLAPLASFIVVFLAFNVWAGASATRDDLLSRKMIYQFYASQGWTDLFDAQSRAAMPDDDFERHGYVRAIALYGAPAENSESLTAAIARNPTAFAARIASNVRQLIDLTAKGKFLSFELLLILAMLPLGFLFLKRSLRLLVFFAAGVFSVIGIFMIFHIDDRYLTIAVPAALFLASLSACGLNRLPMPARFGRNAFAGVVLLVALLQLPTHFAALSHSFERERLDLTPFRLLGEVFREVVGTSPAETARMAVHLDVPLPPALKFSAVPLLFPYFARTSLLWAEPSEPYPRDRLFSLPRCPATHAIVPDPAAGSRPVAGTVYVSQVGSLVVRRLTPTVPAAGTFAAKFCAAH